MNESFNEKDKRIDSKESSPELKFKKAKSAKVNTGSDSESSKSAFRLSVENFFYHYKWHAIVALFLVFTILFISLQTCSRVEYDIHVLYAGGKNLRRPAEGDDGITYNEMNLALTRFVGDINGDGNKIIDFKDIYLPSDAEIREAEARGDGVNYSLLRENDESFRYIMLSGSYYLCLISESLLGEWTSDEKSNPFTKITPYLPEGKESDYELAGEYGVYLSSTPTADNPGFKNLPADTVISLRMLTSRKDADKELFISAENALRNMLTDTAHQS